LDQKIEPKAEEKRPICNAQGQLDVPLVAMFLDKINGRIKEKLTKKTLNNPPAYHKSLSKSLGLLQDARQQLDVLAEVRKNRSDTASLACEVECITWISTSLDDIAKLSCRHDRLLSECAALMAQQMKAAWALHVRKEFEAQAQKKYGYLRHPGASTASDLKLAIPISFGPMPHDGINIGITPYVGVSRSLGNDDEGFIQQSHSCYAGAGLSVSAELSAIAKGEVSLQANVRRTRFDEYNDVPHFVSSTAASSRRSRLFKGARPTTLPVCGQKQKPWDTLALCDLDRLQQAALNEGDRFTTVINMLKASDARKEQDAIALPIERLPSVPLPNGGTTTSLTGQVALSASVGLPQAHLGASATLEGTVSHANTRFIVRQPLWNSVRDQDLPAESTAALAQQARIQTLTTVAPQLNPLLANAMAGATPEADSSSFDVLQADPPALRCLLNFLEQEFDLYCHAWRQFDSGKAAAAKILRKIEKAWQAEKNEFVYLQRLGLAQALIGLRLKTLTATDPTATEPTLSDWQKDLIALDRLANKIYNPPMACDRSVLTRHLTFVDEIPIVTSERELSLTLNAACQLPLDINLGGSINAAFRTRHRVHINPLRAGDYRELAISIGGGAQLNEFISLWRHNAATLSNRLEVDVDTMEQTLQKTVPMLIQFNVDGQITGNLQLLVRFYRPANEAKDPHYTPASGFQLQFVRILGTGSVAYGGLKKQETTVLAERVSPNTLTYAMLRHHRFHTNNDQGKDYWPAFVRKHRTTFFSPLFNNLSDSSSKVADEATTYWNEIFSYAPSEELNALQADCARFSTQMSQYSEAPTEKNFQEALKQLEMFFVAHMKYSWLKKRAEYPHRRADAKLPLITPKKTKIGRYLHHHFSLNP
jgi:hypothetical protein